MKQRSKDLEKEMKERYKQREEDEHHYYDYEKRELRYDPVYYRAPEEDYRRPEPPVQDQKPQESRP